MLNRYTAFIHIGLFSLLLFAGLSDLSAQSLVLDRFDVFNRNVDVERDSLYMGFQSSIEYADESEQSYFSVLPFYSYSSHNSEYADGFNDGAHWQGRGINQALSFGLQGRKGGFEYTIAPIFSYAENRPYKYGVDSSSYNRPEFQNQFTTGIDYVMRYGDEAQSKIYEGQLEIAYRFSKLRVSLGTANQWWGPGIYQSALMTNNAPGFWHLRVENHKPYTSYIGDFSFQYMSGILQESEYFNNNSNDDQRIYNGLVVSYAPTFFGGMTLTMNRVIMMQKEDSDSFADYGLMVTDFFRTSQVNPDGTITERKDQIIAIGLDWRSSSDHFRAYMEWVRGDFASDIIDFFEQPDHNAGYIWGFAKRFPIKGYEGQYIQLSFEQANLGTWETRRIRPSTSMYTHGQVTQGLTNNGQILASSIGPGSSFHGIKLLWGRSDTEQFSLEYLRTRFNDDYHFLKKNSIFFDIEHHLALTWERKLNSQLSFVLNSGVGIRDNPFNRDDEYVFNIRNQLIIRYLFN